VRAAGEEERVHGRIELLAGLQMSTRMGRRLTPRECEVLHHLLEGESNKEIANALVCSLRTIECHVTSILKKHGVATRLRLLAVLSEKAPAAKISPLNS
jgi:two-component system response regulator FixJ